MCEYSVCVCGGVLQANVEDWCVSMCVCVWGIKCKCVNTDKLM